MKVIFQSGIFFAEMYHLMQADKKILLFLKYDDVYKVLTGHGIIYLTASRQSENVKYDVQAGTHSWKGHCPFSLQCQECVQLSFVIKPR